ncbi:RICIN domain-containing protein [Dactylosporangium sp. NPDC048998]|uniref:RICIN domain-containing protein n=1 Tax=Dactylosporangium sp. NPDC048998 TaxID=3363976 RepID=UPI00371E71C4
MDEEAGEWQRAHYWPPYSDLLSEGRPDEAGHEGPPPARRLGRAWGWTLVRGVVMPMAVTVVFAAIGPWWRSALPSSAEATTSGAPTADTTGVPLEPVPASSPADTSAGDVPSKTPGEQTVLREPSPTPPATAPSPESTGVRPTPAGSRTVSPTPQPTRTTPLATVRIIAPAAGMVVRVVSQASGDSVGVSRGSTSDGALIVSSSDTSATAQQWRLIAAGEGCFGLINVRSGKALDNPDGSSVDGEQMQQWTAFAGNINQAWCFQPVGAGWYSIRNLAAGTLLDLRDGGRNDGTAIQQWGADPAMPDANQTWQLLRVG